MYEFLKDHKIRRGEDYQKSKSNEGKDKDQKSAPWQITTLYHLLDSIRG